MLFLGKNPAKWLFYGLIELCSVLRRILGERRVAVVHGAIPTRPYLQYKMFKLAGIRLVRPPQVATLQYAHFDTTIRETTPGLNGACTDIRKSTVAAVFAEVAGYALTVDPQNHIGPMVRKSETNAAHDGEVVIGPLPPAPGYTFQHLVDAVDGDGKWTDLRPCIVGREIPFVYVKKRSVAKRFANDGNEVAAVSAPAVFSDREIGQLLEIASRLGLDIGEMDVVRDQADGRIYVVDVANTPHSPSDAFITWSGFRCMWEAAACFRRQHLS